MWVCFYVFLITPIIIINTMILLCTVLNSTTFVMGFSPFLSRISDVTSLYLPLPLFSYLKILLDWKIRPKWLEWHLKWKEVFESGLDNLLNIFECYKISLWKYISMCLFFWLLLKIFLFSILDWDSR